MLPATAGDTQPTLSGSSFERNGWEPEEQVTDNRSDNDLRMGNGHRIVVDGDGLRHLVWAGHYKRYYPGSGWTTDLEVRNSRFPAIALDPDGRTIHVVWQGSAGMGALPTEHVFYQKCVPDASGNGGWVGAPRDLTPEGHNCRVPSIACFRDVNGVDHVVVAWDVWGCDSVGFCECVAGVWGNPLFLAGPGNGELAWYASIAADPRARLGDVFISYAPTGGSPFGERVYVFRRQKGVWQPRELAMPDTVDASYMSSCIEVDPCTGCPHVVSYAKEGHFPHEVYQICHTCRDLELGWLPVETISNQFHSSGWPPHPNMIVTGGSVHVVWPENSSGVCGIRCSAGQYGNWGMPAWVTSDHIGNNPDVAAVTTGGIYVVWQDGRLGTDQIWGRLHRAGCPGGLAAGPAGFLLTHEPMFELGIVV